ncbi:Spy/CpxP family protein refolding chaperone [Roseateles violae]|uniref:Spy/CpxP family protein refolding chaperone n=1 Tax=Roseateles violae TaxID=3058042 RepID=A0ABT8DUR8_9BURK|nr:Spy/CpxP family protein refolding chaperone [Pelomonas sp. PFR6]MDN3921863.1 Spy/CpxP family protein refolding chaperone [Pelomonas sp. PFR6]
MSKLNLIDVLKTGAIASALALSGFAAQAQDHHPMRGGPGGPGLFDGGRIEHLLDDVDASDAQRAQIRQIMQAARKDLQPQREAGRKLHEQGLALFAAPTIDANAFESLRQQTQALHEQVGKRMTQAMVEAARVLTPQQRATLAEKMKKRQARMAEHMRERAASKPSN